MEYKPSKGNGIYYISIVMVIYNVLLAVILVLENSYLFVNLLKVLLLVSNIYALYYIFTYYPKKIILNEESIKIVSLLNFRVLKIMVDDIEKYNIAEGNIKGVRLSGFARNSFAFGKTVVSKIGTTRMFVTSSKKIIYMKTKDGNIALSPVDVDKFENFLIEKNIEKSEWTYIVDRTSSFHKDRKFIIPLILSSIFTIFITLYPFYLYLRNNLPAKMPLSINAKFQPVTYCTGKQFAINQMGYGFLNMGILFCMYFASSFYARYDKKSAYKFMYISLVIAFVFLLVQLKIIGIGG